jgi:outer membrane protein TolC
MNKRVLFLTVALVGMSFSAYAAETSSSAPLTVDAAVQEALRDSPTIQSSEAAVSESSWHKFQMIGNGFLPKLSAGFNHFFGESYETTAINFGGSLLNFPGAYPTNILTVNASIPLFDGLANIENTQAASLQKTAAEEELDRAKFQLGQEVKLAFYQALAAAQLQDVARENVKTLEDHLKDVEIQRHGGAATKYDSLRVSVQLSEGRADQIDADDNAALARKKLTALLVMRRIWSFQELQRIVRTFKL